MGVYVMGKHYRFTNVRTLLLLAIAFVAGAAAEPITDLVVQRFTRAIVISAASAQDVPQTDTYRLLALFGDVFELVRTDYVDQVPDRELVENAIKGMLTGLDPHSAFLDAAEVHELDIDDEGKFGGVGLDVMAEDGVVKVISPMSGTPAFRAGIRAGDIIIALNGKSVEQASPERIIDQMRGPPNTRVTLTIKRPGEDHPRILSMRREVIRIPVVENRLTPDKIGYVRISEFSDPTDASLRRAVRSFRRRAGGTLRALVLDLRDNPGGLLDQAVAVARDFIPHGEIVSTRGRDSDDSEWLPATGTDILGGAPMVVLINSGTASASEVVAGALQDHRRAVLVGTRSFGKGSVQTTIPLPDGAVLLLTTERYYTPSGRSIQGRGVLPDVVVGDNAKDVSRFEPQHEADLSHAISNVGGTPDVSEPSRVDLPSLFAAVPSKPPRDFPEFDPSQPKTDFQLQQAFAVVKAMVASRKSAGHDR
jgi:carboxyl-terminal processing protease